MGGGHICLHGRLISWYSDALWLIPLSLTTFFKQLVWLKASRIRLERPLANLVQASTATPRGVSELQHTEGLNLCVFNSDPQGSSKLHGDEGEEACEE